jgi:hypothetical protein
MARYVVKFQDEMYPPEWQVVDMYTVTPVIRQCGVNAEEDVYIQAEYLNNEHALALEDF